MKTAKETLDEMARNIRRHDFQYCVDECLWDCEAIAIKAMQVYAIQVAEAVKKVALDAAVNYGNPKSIFDYINKIDINQFK